MTAMILRLLLLALISTLGVSGSALPDTGESHGLDKRQATNRLVFAHFMVCDKQLTQDGNGNFIDGCPLA